MPFKKLWTNLMEAWSGLLRGGIMPLVAATIISVSIFVLGVFLLISFNLNNILQMLHSKLDIVAYVADDVDPVSLEAMNLQISHLPGIKRFEFVSKEEAWKKFQENYYNLHLTDMVDNNPLPDAFKIEVKDLDNIKELADKIAAIKGVDDIRYGGDIAERVSFFTKLISLAGLVLIFLLVIATLTIVVNTIRLTVLARENEINIMSLVGATDRFIKKPFIMEGFILGFLGSTVAVIVLKIVYNFIVVGIERNIPFLPFNLSGTEVNYVFGAVFMIGVLLGIIGGYVSVSKSLHPNES